jgi:hypothetical protein
LIWTWEHGTCFYNTPASVEMALLWTIHWLSRRYDSQFVLLASINFLSITLIDKQIYWSLDSFSISFSLILHRLGHLRLKSSNLQLHSNHFTRPLSQDKSFTTAFSPQGPLSLWQLPVFPDFRDPQEHNVRDTSMFDGQDLESQTASPEFSHPQIPQFVLPQELHMSPSPTESTSSPQSG